MHLVPVLIKYNLVSLLLLFLMFPAAAQTPTVRFNSLSTKNGLSHNQVLMIYKDSSGLIWICTQDGLNMFDGYKFRVFRHEPGNINSLSDYAVTSICESSPGIYWVGTREGLDYFNLRQMKFVHYKNDVNNKNSLTDNTVWTVTCSESGIVWIGTKNGLSSFDPVSGSFKNYSSEAPEGKRLTDSYVTSVLEDKAGRIWIGTRSGLDMLDPVSGRIINLKPDFKNPESFLSNSIIRIHIDKNNQLWIPTYSGLYSLDLNRKEFKSSDIVNHLKEEVNDIGIRTVCSGYDGTIWAGTTNKGLLKYDPNTRKIQWFRKSFDRYSLAENDIYSVLEDENRVLWIGLRNKGINKLNRHSERFKTFIAPYPDSFSSFEIKSICKDSKNRLWLGTRDGNLYKVSDGITEKISSPEGKKFSSAEITMIRQQSNGNLWITTFGDGIYHLNPDNLDRKHYKNEVNNPASLSNNFVHCVLEDSDGDLWFGTGTGGLNKLTGSDGSFISYKNIPGDSNSISSNEIIALGEDENGLLWLGTPTGGLNKFYKNTGKVFRYLHSTEGRGSISSNRIVYIFNDSKQRLWVATFGGGLNLFDEETDSFRSITADDGLPGNVITSVEEDNSGMLWISTNKGLARFNTEKKEILIYNFNDGLQGDEFLAASSFYDKGNNLLYFGGVNGYTEFRPDDITKTLSPPRIVFTEFRIYGSPVKISAEDGEETPLHKHILFTDSLIISNSDNYISFEFASLDYNNPDKNRYTYRLEGFNNNWISTGERRFITFTNLDPGSYTLKVKGTNSDGVWSLEEAELHITILPPWWRTWWAYSLYFIFILVILYFVRQFELKRIKLKNQLEIKHLETEKLQEVDRLKSRFFTNISHEFRTPLTLIRGLIDKISADLKGREFSADLRVMRQNSERLLTLINQMLELSRIEAGKVKLSISKNDIGKFLKRVLVSFESVAAQKNISLIINGQDASDFKPEKGTALYFDRERFETVFYNLFTNAIKFSPHGSKVVTEINPRLHTVEITITNTGTGISHEKLRHIFDRFYRADESAGSGLTGTGIGLALVKEIIELHSGEIHVQSDGQSFTSFIIKIPVGRAHFDAEQIIDEILHEEAGIADSYLKASVEAELMGIPTVDTEEKRLPEGKGTELILVVEDNTDLRKFISDQLTEDYIVYEAENGKTGLNLAVEIIPDLIITDVIMPEMDGLEMCKKIKNDFKLSHIPVVMLTAKATHEEKMEGLQSGADDYLLKPFDARELKLKIKNLLFSRRQLREKIHIDMYQKPKEVSVPSTERIFIEKLNNITEANLADEKFGVDKLAAEMGMSRTQLHRKMRAVCDQSTTEFIRNFRLQRAADLIKQNAGNMAEIAYRVGFNSQAYFTKSFQEFFGCSPGEYKKREQK